MNSTKLIHAPASTIYAALTTARALETWQAPHTMTGKVHAIDVREGGGYSMSLYYPADEKQFAGKTAPNEDRFDVQFEKLVPDQLIIQTVNFNTSDPQFMGKMKMKIMLITKENGTEVTFQYSDLPIGISEEDNEAGTASSLQKLSEYTEEQFHAKLT